MAQIVLLAAILRSRAAQSPQLVEIVVPASVAETELIAAILPSAVEPSMLQAEIMVLESEAVEEVQIMAPVVIFSSAVEPSLLQAVKMRPVLAEVEGTMPKL